jgi:hypothetical protein
MNEKRAERRDSIAAGRVGGTGAALRAVAVAAGSSSVAAGKSPVAAGKSFVVAGKSPAVAGKSSGEGEVESGGVKAQGSIVEKEKPPGRSPIATCPVVFWGAIVVRYERLRRAFLSSNHPSRW